MKRKGQAVWRGGGKDGTGTLTTPSGVLNDTPYSAKLRFENEDGRAGTNPEELIAAAHAGCYSMALAFQLAGEGITPEELNTSAEVDIQQEGGGYTIKTVHLTLRARVPGIDKAKFDELAKAAKEGCPVSKVLNADITLDATLA
ncbi:MAG: OsmC family protein [Longimicrobiales bacterium]